MKAPLEDSSNLPNCCGCQCPRWSVDDFSVAQTENVLFIAGFVRDLVRFPPGRKRKKKSTLLTKRPPRPKLDQFALPDDFEDFDDI
jgi:hypothetical protein